MYFEIVVLMLFVFLNFYLYFTNLKCDAGKFGPHCKKECPYPLMEIFARLNVIAMKVFAILMTVVQVKVRCRFLITVSRIICDINMHY